MHHRRYSLFIQTKPQAAPDTSFFGPSLFAYQNGNDRDLHPWMPYEWIGEVRVYRVDGERRRIRQRVVTLVFQLRFVRERKISFGDENLRNGMAAAGVKYNAHVDPDRHRLPGEFARLKC